jgi:Ca2+-binding EF-hand superfamily protein
MSSDYISQMREKMFNSLDGGGDGKLDKTEIAQAMGDASQAGDSASNLVSQLDSDGAGALSQVEFEAGLAKLHHEMKQQQTGDGGDLFSKIDTDGDGSVSKEEFVSNRPEEVSEDQANEMWSQLDADGTGSLTQSRFVSAMEKQGPPPGPPPGGFAGQDAAERVSSTTKTSSSGADDTARTDSSTSVSNDSGSDLEQLLTAALQKYLQSTSGYFGQSFAAGGFAAYA